MHTIFRLNIWLPPALNGIRSVTVFLVYFECPVYMNIMWCIPSFGSDSWWHIQHWHACLTNTTTFYLSFPKWHVSSHVFADTVTFDVVMWCIPSFAWIYDCHLLWTEFVVWKCFWCTLNAQCIWILCDAYHLSGLTLDDIFNTDMLV